MGNPEVAYKDLLDIHQRFITRDALRQAIATVVNRLFELRWPQLWVRNDGLCRRFTTFPGVGPESHDLVAWVYGKPGVMIYWHVERKAVCIDSQLKSVCVLRSGGDDRRGVTALHDHGSRPPVCR